MQYVIRTGSSSPGYTIGSGDVHPPLASRTPVSNIRVKAVNAVGVSRPGHGPDAPVVTITDATVPSAPQHLHTGVASTQEVRQRAHKCVCRACVCVMCLHASAAVCQCVPWWKGHVDVLVVALLQWMCRCLMRA